MSREKNRDKNINSIKVRVYKDDQGMVTGAGCNRILTCNHELMGEEKVSPNAEETPCNTTVEMGTTFPGSSTVFSDLVDTYKVKVPDKGYWWVSKADYDENIALCNGCCVPAPCPLVSGFAVPTLGDTFADITWNAVGGATGYEYVVNTTGTLPVDGDPAIFTSAAGVDLTGLTPTTTYTFFVRVICGNGNVGAWSLAGAFGTV